MKRAPLLHFPVALLLALGSAPALRAAEDPVPPPGRPTREEMREKLKDLSPEQRERKLREIREKSGPGGAFKGPMSEEMKKRRAEFDQFRESLQGLPLPEREAKLREWRGKNAATRPLDGPGTLTPEERESKRKEFLTRIDAQLEALNKKKAAGTLTEDETLRLGQLEKVKQRMESAARPSPGLPPPRPTEEKPVKPIQPSEKK